MTDRSRDVSDELTEVRTVLSRAETALARLAYYERRRDSERRILRWETRLLTGNYEPVYGAWETDPDIEAMKVALEITIANLSIWRKAGSTGATRRRRWITGA